jgi:hypothetical protein
VGDVTFVVVVREDLMCRNMILHEKNNVRFTMVRFPEGPWYQVIQLEVAGQPARVQHEGNNRLQAEAVFRKLTGASDLVAPEKYVDSQRHHRGLLFGLVKL